MIILDRDDAENAKDRISSLDGRKLFISYADRKRENKKRKKKGGKEESGEDADRTATGGKFRDDDRTGKKDDMDDSSDEDDLPVKETVAQKHVDKGSCVNIEFASNGFLTYVENQKAN